MVRLETSNGATRRRRLGAWGFEGEEYLPSPQMLAWLQERIGLSSPYPTLDRTRLAAPTPRLLPELPGEHSCDPLDRLTHARGQGLTDLLRLRSGTVPALPDTVARPQNDADVESILRSCARAGVRVVPWGGGTSVTGGVNIIPTAAPAVSLDLAALSGLQSFDETSHLAVFGAGTSGPAIEAALGARGCTLGHFPQSWELSTLGGWVVTRASGQESLGYGDIHNIVAGLELVAPNGRLVLPAFPSSAAGPDLRELVLGSEGRLGVVTRVTVRIRPRPPQVRAAATLLPSWQDGLDGVRALVQQAVPLTLIRLSDEPETETAMAIGLSRHPWAAGLVRGGLRLRGIRGSGCLMLCAAAGHERQVRETWERAATILHAHGGVGLGSAPGRRWLAERFRHPYLRDALLDRGIATDTLETAAPWSRVAQLTDDVRRALSGALAAENEATAVLCHVSHPYRDGTSLYFTFFFRCPTDVEHAVARWATLKRAATAAIVAGGGTLSHHHGVGSWHAPWFKDEVGEAGVRVLKAAAHALDPAGILNPHVLLDPIDRLEV
ncbi:MAG TPA: FAD-binding oxidoreductase [Candidatus Margulisiibacteriota bacterium]|nr:FAD-binding oxidoreductase [Candidatus Margulisiibacteriota bacterium]